MTALPFETSNAEAFVLLTRIEVCLRELLRETYVESEVTDGRSGKGWQKRLPGGLLRVIRDAQRDEEARRQFDFVRLGPLYYLTYGELIGLFDVAPGSKIVTRIGGNHMLVQLKGLTHPRNAVAHSRGLSNVALLTVRNTYDQFRSAIGSEQMDRLLAAPNEGLRPEVARRVLKPWLINLKQELAEYAVQASAPPFKEEMAAQFWWQDPSLAEFDTERVQTIFQLISEYNQFPTGLGSANNRRLFLRNTSLETLITEALNELQLERY